MSPSIAQLCWDPLDVALIKDTEASSKLHTCVCVCVCMHELLKARIPPLISTLYKGVQSELSAIFECNPLLSKVNHEHAQSVHVTMCDFCVHGWRTKPPFEAN